MARAITKCPRCHEPVSPFAAGCAICGEDLEAARARLTSRKGRSLPSLPRAGADLDWWQIVVAVVLAIALSPVGFLLSLYWARQRHLAGEPVMVGAMLLTAALSVASFFAPMWFWSHVL